MFQEIVIQFSCYTSFHTFTLVRMTDKSNANRRYVNSGMHLTRITSPSLEQTLNQSSQVQIVMATMQ